MPDISENIPALMLESEFAAWLGVSSGTVRQKYRDGVFVKDGKYFDVQKSVQNYLGALRDRAVHAGGASKSNPELDAEKLRVQKATAKKLELANAKAQGELVDSLVVEREWSSILRDVRSAVLAVPARVGGSLPHLTPHDLAELEREIKAALEALAKGEPDEFEY